MIQTVIDVQRLLRRFGIIVYTGKRATDLAWMEEEVKELYRAQLIDQEQLQQALLVLKKEQQAYNK